MKNTPKVYVTRGMVEIGDTIYTTKRTFKNSKSTYIDDFNGIVKNVAHFDHGYLFHFENGTYKFAHNSIGYLFQVDDT